MWYKVSSGVGSGLVTIHFGVGQEMLMIQWKTADHAAMLSVNHVNWQILDKVQPVLTEMAQCNGQRISPNEFVAILEANGYRDARKRPHSRYTFKQIRENRWTSILFGIDGHQVKVQWNPHITGNLAPRIVIDEKGWKKLAEISYLFESLPLNTNSVGFANWLKDFGFEEVE